MATRMQTKQERAAELVNRLLDLIEQAAAHPAAYESLREAALRTRDELFRLWADDRPPPS